MDLASMLITVGVAATTALIVLTAFALADVLENGAMPAPVARAWLATITLVPGIGALLWLRERGRINGNADPAQRVQAAAPYPSAADLELMHEEIDRFRSTQA